MAGYTGVDCPQSQVEKHGDFDGVKETLTFLMLVSDDVTVGPSCSDGITEGVVSAGGSSHWWNVHFFGYVGTTSFSNATGTWLVGTQNMTCTASDAAGNTGSQSFVVTTYYKEPDPPADTTPPTSASGTFTITDGTNGGDCTSIGTWNSGSKTCTVTATITGTIIIGSERNNP